MARLSSLIPFVVRIVVVVVALLALDAMVPDLSTWWRLLIAVLISLLAGYLAERVLRQDRRPRGDEGRPTR